MTNNRTDNTNKVDQQAETDPLMDVYNPLPPQSEQPARFYWQEPWHGTNGDGGAADVQAAFEN